MGVWASTLLSVAIVSAIPLAGLAFAPHHGRRLQGAVPYLVSFAAGGLLGAAAFHLLPKAAEHLGTGHILSAWFLGGFILFFLLEEFLWIHEHDVRRESSPDDKEEEEDPNIALHLLSDGVDNLLDGMLIAACFIIDPALGISTTVAVVLHEVPQELSDFGLLVRAGISPRRAVFYNSLSAGAAIGGAIAVLSLSSILPGLAPVLLAIAAGGFLYTAGTDLLPELQEQGRLTVAVRGMGLVLLGTGLLVALSLISG